MTKVEKLSFLAIISLAFLGLLGFYFTYYLFYENKALPNVFIANTPLRGLTAHEIETLIKSTYPMPNEIVVNFSGTPKSISTNDLKLEYDYSSTSFAAVSAKRGDTKITRLTNPVLKIYEKIDIPLIIKYDKEKLDEFLLINSAEALPLSIPPRVELIEGKVAVYKGEKGSLVDIENTIKSIEYALKSYHFDGLEVIIREEDPTLSGEEIKRIEDKANALITKELILIYKEKSIRIADSEIVPAIDPNESWSKDGLSAITKKVSDQINQKAKNAVFKYENGKVLEFVPSQNGLAVETEKLNNLLREALDELLETNENSITITIPVVETNAEITTDKVNDLGLRELIGVGNSKFSGSISSRIHNIGLAASKFDSVLVKPNEEISFNQILGDVSTYTGYLQAYVIKDGQTVLGDGGGVCQVSTTLFRAALNAGLEITQRRAHSYRVSYYEQGSPPGLDATVYAPYTDLKIKNNTPGHILIQTRFDGKNATLSFELFGTKDGRIVNISKPVITSTSPPPEPLYTDDPTLPLGEIRQIDWAAPGAKVQFNYQVIKDGNEIISETFYSNYTPWQAKFLRGTAPAN